MHSALKQARKEAAAGSETSLHKYLWTITLPTALTLQHRSPFWAGFLQNPRKSSYDHQPQSSCMAPALGLSYSELVQRLKTTKSEAYNSLVCTHVRWGNTICAFVLSYNSLTSKCRAPLPQLVLASVSSLCIRVYAQCFIHTGKILRILLIFSLKSSSHAN